MFKVKKKNKICRKYSQDIWGILIKRKKFTKVVKYLLQLKKEKWLKYKPFFLDITAKKPLKQRRVRSRFGKNLDTLKKLSFFCGGLRKKKLKQIIKIAEINSGSFLENFYGLIELRLVLVVYRLNFCKTIFEAMQYIYAGYVMVNKEIIKQINFIVKVGDIIELIGYKRRKLFKKLKVSLKRQNLFLMQPHFTYINYELFLCIIVGNLLPGLMRYPFKISKQYGYMLQKNKF